MTRWYSVADSGLLCPLTSTETSDFLTKLVRHATASGKVLSQPAATTLTACEAKSPMKIERPAQHNALVLRKPLLAPIQCRPQAPGSLGARRT
jgi:hypothetical protein